jgi:SAM-dependent methyltransferase
MEHHHKEPKFAKPGKMLDIGCGNGWVIYQRKMEGWDVYGVEPGLGAEVGKAHGLDIYHGDLLSAQFPDATFDYIRSNHSFEHIHNPENVMKEIFRILKPNGKVFIGVPNIRSFNAKVFKQYWYYLGAPVHTYNWSDKTLPKFLEKHGFMVEKVIYSAQLIGVLGSWQIFLNRKSGQTSDKGFWVKHIITHPIFGFIAQICNRLRTGDCIEVIAAKQ